MLTHREAQTRCPGPDSPIYTTMIRQPSDSFPNRSSKSLPSTTVSVAFTEPSTRKNTAGIPTSLCIRARRQVRGPLLVIHQWHGTNMSNDRESKQDRWFPQTLCRGAPEPVSRHPHRPATTATQEVNAVSGNKSNNLWCSEAVPTRIPLRYPVEPRAEFSPASGLSGAPSKGRGRRPVLGDGGLLGFGGWNTEQQASQLWVPIWSLFLLIRI